MKILGFEAGELEEKIRSYENSTLILKVSGKNLESGGESGLEAACWNIALMQKLLGSCNVRIIAVHGAGPQIYKAIEAAGLENRKVEGLTYTNGVIYNIVENEILRLRDFFVKHLESCSVKAELLPKRFVAATSMGEKYGGRVGKPIAIDYNPLSLATKGSIQVASSWGVDTSGSPSYKINADDVAAILVAKLKPILWINVTSVGGILTDINDKSSVVPKLNIEEAVRLSYGRMELKVNAVKSALEASPETKVVVTSPSGMVNSLFGKSGTILTYK